MHILLVEDDEAHIELIKRGAGDFHGEYRLDVARDLEQARSFLAENTPDVVVADLVLPDGQGMELLDGSGPGSDFALVLMTSHGDERVAVEAMKAGAADYVVKTRDTMLDMMRMAERAWLDWRVARERDRAERSLRESEERYRFLIENMNEVVYTIDVAGRFTYVSPRVGQVIGYSPEEMIGRKFPDFLHEDDRDLISGRFMEVLAGDLRGSEYRIRDRKGDVRWVASSSRPVYRDGEVAGLQGMFYDVTDRRVAEEENTELLARLQHSQKMEAVGTLAGGIAHDFNNILGAILGYSEMALYDADNADSVRASLTEALKSIHRAKDLVKQMLTFAQKSGIRQQPLRLDILVRDSIRFLRASLPSTIYIRDDIPMEGPTVRADSMQMRQILMNLGSNAADAMSRTGGRLDIRLDTVYLGPDSEVLEFDRPCGEYACLEVSDTGEGMDELTLQRVFEPYFTTKDKSRGTGLGLSEVHGIATSHGGFVRAASIPGKGSSFHVYLPVVGGVEQEHLESDWPAGDRRGTLLFVDDEPALVDISRKMLERLGYTVVAETSSLAALERFRAAPESFDAVITDMTMPTPRGDELAEMILEIRPDLPVLLTTGYSEVLDEDEVREKGVREVVLKPLSMGLLLEALDRVLDDGGD